MIYGKFAKFFDRYASRYDYSMWFEYLKQVSGISDFSAKKILEFGCGTGEILTRFASEGAEVYGIDQSDEMLSYADEKFFSKNLSAVLLKCDMSEFFSEKKFDFIFSMGDSVNYLNKSQTEKLLRNTSEMMSDYACFAFDIISPEAEGRIKLTEEIYAQGARVSLKREFSEDMLITYAEIHEGGKSASEIHRQYLYSTEYLSGLASECGFSRFDSWGIFTFEAESGSDEKLQCRLRKY